MIFFHLKTDWPKVFLLSFRSEEEEEGGEIREVSKNVLIFKWQKLRSAFILI